MDEKNGVGGCGCRVNVFDWWVDVAAIENCTRVEESQAAWWVHYFDARKPGFIMPIIRGAEERINKAKEDGRLAMPGLMSGRSFMTPSGLEVVVALKAETGPVLLRAANFLKDKGPDNVEEGRNEGDFASAAASRSAFTRLRHGHSSDVAHGRPCSCQTEL